MSPSTDRIGSVGAISNPDKPEVEIGGRHVRLEDVLPRDRPHWWSIKNLVLLNTCLLVPMVANSSNGYDGSLLNGLQ
jgi:hypothetical protein